jgi:hypothetical protein
MWLLLLLLLPYLVLMFILLFMNKRTLRINRSKFNQFVTGVRAVEILIGKPKYSDWVGKKVQIYCDDKSHYLTLVSANHYDTLDGYITNTKAKIRINTENTREITPEQIKKTGGINVLHFKN